MSGVRSRSRGHARAVGRGGSGLAPGHEGDERAYLYSIIQTIGSGPDLDSVLAGIVHLATEATNCHACLVWFAEGDRFVLRAASPPYAHLAGTVSLAESEGLVGWVARTRRSAFIRERALEDPRVKYFEELEEERFQSLVSVPVFERAGEVMGVISLHAEAPHEFARTDLDLLEHTASLMSGAVENARLFEEATHRVRMLEGLSDLSRRIASASSTDQVLRAVTEGIGSILPAIRAEIYLADAEGHLRLRSAHPPRADAPVLESTSAVRRELGAEVDPITPRLLWGSGFTGVPAIEPLVAGEERLGTIAVELAQLTPEADTALAAIAAHAAVAIRQHQLIDWLREKNVVKDFFQSLATGAPPGEVGALAERLGADSEATHLLLRCVPATVTERRRPADGQERRSWREVAAQVEGRLAARFRDALFDHQEGSLGALIPLAGSDPEEAVDALRGMGWDDTPGALTVGVSNPCAGAASFPRGFQEAASAAEVGALIRGPGVTTFDDLGPYRYVLASDDGEPDRYQSALGHVVEYDDQRGTQLLDTLGGYLDHRGNVVATSRALYIHPNTLRQRLDRIEQVSGLDLARDDWLSMAIAAKVVKLRKMRETAGREGRD